MSSSTGLIMMQAHVVDVDGKVFLEVVSEHIRDSGRRGHYTEVQYSSATQLNGKIAYSALILSRLKEDVI